MISIATIGGILLCIGAILTFNGKVYQAVITYLFADMCWIYLTYSTGDYQAFGFTLFGTILCFGAFVKMHLGMMLKSLNHGKG